MKYIKFMMMALMTCFMNYSYSQNYSGVITLDSTYTKSILYSNGLSFFANTFKSSNDVIQMKDSESGKIIGKGIADNRDVKITISCKDGKYKYDIEIDPIKNYTFTLNTKYFGDELWVGKSTEGTSKIDLLFDENGKSLLSFQDYKSQTYFEFSKTGPFSGSSGVRFYYDENHPHHNPWPGTKSRYQDWKIMIDKEFASKDNLSYLFKPSDKVAEGLVEILKSEMSKLDW